MAHDDVIPPPPVPLHVQLLQWKHLAFYGHYAAVGLIMSTTDLSQNVCFYYFRGPDNVCANSWALVVIPWGLKLPYAILVDCWCGPFGETHRRKFYLCLGWGCSLAIILALALWADSSVQAWLGLSLLSQVCAVLAVTTQDGLVIELGQMESPSERGTVLAMGQRVRYVATLVGSFIQAVLVNGPSCNPPNCEVDRPGGRGFGGCWSWGLTPPQYYGLVFSLLLVLLLPLNVFQDPTCRTGRPPAVPRTLTEHRCMLWQTLSTPSTLYLLIFVAGTNLFSLLMSIVQWYLQYKIIKISNFQSGISAALSAAVAALAIYLFQRYMIAANWRVSQRINVIFCALVGLAWILIYHDVWGLMNPWFSVFLQINMSISGAITQLLAGLAITEVAPSGQQTTTYALVLSLANSCMTLSNLLATQLLTTLGIDTCVRAVHDQCHDKNAVDLHSRASFVASHGPEKFTLYSLAILGINFGGMLLFTGFLPSGKQQCREWKGALDAGGDNEDTSVAVEMVDMTENPLADADASRAVSQRGEEGVEVTKKPTGKVGVCLTLLGVCARAWAAQTLGPLRGLAALCWTSLFGQASHVGWASAALLGAVLLYQCVYALGLLIPQASCSVAFGGGGC